MEAKVSRGGKVTKMDVESLTEMLMTKLVELDEIVSVEGDLKLQRKAQVYWICYYSLSFSVTHCFNSYSLLSQ